MKKVWKLFLILSLVLTMVAGALSVSAFAATEKKSSTEITLEKLLPKAICVEKNKDVGLRGEVRVTLDFPNAGGVVYLPGAADASKLCFSWDTKGVTFSKGGKTYKSGKAPIAKAGEKVTYTVSNGTLSAPLTIKTMQGSSKVDAAFIELDESKGSALYMQLDPDHEKEAFGVIKVGDRVLFDAAKRVNVPAEKRNIGIVFQDYAVWPHMTVLENVCYPLKKQRRAKDEIRQRAMRALEQVHMTEYANHLPNQLSGGQQQRVAIARALVVDSDVLVMDEPITNLDAKLREEMLLEIRMIQKRLNATILYITHDQQSALQLCDKMAIMEQNGSLCQYGTDEEIILRPANRFTFEFIGVSNFIPLEKDAGGLKLNSRKRKTAGMTWACGPTTSYSTPRRR